MPAGLGSFPAEQGSRPAEQSDGRKGQRFQQALFIDGSGHPVMTHPHHHHRPGDAHPAARVPPSLLRLSAAERLAAAAVAIALMWGVVVWAIA
jgi:hypothetical protein